MGDDRTSPRWLRPAVTGALVLYTLRILATWREWHLPDFVNLPVHETGHLVFGWGGPIIAALGGTILQVGFPLAFAVAFWHRRDSLGVGVATWWSGQNLVNVARYAADAREQALPLVGGGVHDWGFLLAEWNLLHRTDAVARGIALAGVAVMVAGVVMSLREVSRES